MFWRRAKFARASKRSSPPPLKSAVCSKLSPITLARPNLLLSCGTSHKVSSQSGSTYFTDSTTQKYSRNQKLCICEMWMAWDLRPPFASVWPWPNPISPIIRTVHHDPARRRNPYGILPLWCNPPKIKEPPIMTQTHPHHFEIPQKKILMSYISSIDYNSTVVQIFVGHRKFQLAKCKMHLTMNRIVVYTYSIITQE